MLLYIYWKLSVCVVLKDWSLSWFGFQLGVVELVLKHRGLCLCLGSERSHIGMYEKTTYLKSKSVVGWKYHQVIGSANITLNPRVFWVFDNPPLRKSYFIIFGLQVNSVLRDKVALCSRWHKCYVWQRGELNTASEGLPLMEHLFLWKNPHHSEVISW